MTNATCHRLMNVKHESFSFVIEMRLYLEWMGNSFGPASSCNSDRDEDSCRWIWFPQYSIGAYPTSLRLDRLTWCALQEIG